MPWSRDQIGYCSNVHAGETLEEVADNCRRFTAGVRRRRQLESMQHGLWLANRAATDSEIDVLKRAGRDSGLRIATMNAFPYGDFHAGQVKQSVYEPHWGEVSRLEYTLAVAERLASLMPEEETAGTLSTVPLGYARSWDSAQQAAALKHLCMAAQRLQALEAETGKHIRLCLEMEPGCVLEETPQVLDLFGRQLPAAMRAVGGDQSALQRYLGVCFDVCHQAVMYEDIDASLRSIHDAGIVVGKIQISSALKIRSPGRLEVQAWLRDYAESRYLHQTTALNAAGEILFCEDLSMALNDRGFLSADEWRIHFHVPVHQSRLNAEWAGTTSDEIDRVCAFLAAHPDCKPQLELETYTWTVLPEQLRPSSDADLIEGLTAELSYVESVLHRHGLLAETARA